MKMDLNILARTLAERLIGSSRYGDYTAETVRLDAVEAVIREAIDKTLEAAIEQCDDYVLGTDGDGFKEAVEQCMEAIRSLKQSNAVAEDEGPCAACGQPKSDSAMHLDSPGKGWGAALHWFKQSNSGRAESSEGKVGGDNAGRN